MRFHPNEKETGERLDAVVAARSAAPRSAAQEAIRSGGITVSGKTVRPSHRLAPDDEVEGEVELKVDTLPLPEDIPLEIRYSDERVLVIAKPPGLVTHPAGGHETGTVVNALLALEGSLSNVDPMRPGIVHRLDKDTSGLLLVARDDEAHHFLTEALKRREVERSYWALVRGVMETPSGAVEAPVGRHQSRRRQAVTSDGKHAVTHYRLIEAGHGCSLLEISLETGRTHQIRVHMSHIKHPVLGDAAYGGRSELSERLGLKRPFLHAYKLAFPHPSTGERIELTEPLPEDLAGALGRAGLEPVHN